MLLKKVSWTIRRADHLNISHETTRISWECLEDFLRPEKILTRNIPKWRWFIDRNNTEAKFTRTSKEKSRFLYHFKSTARNFLHKPSTISSSLLCYYKAGKDCWKNAKHINIFPRQFKSARGYFLPAKLKRHAVLSYISKSGKALDWDN